MFTYLQKVLHDLCHVIPIGVEEDVPHLGDVVGGGWQLHGDVMR